MAMLPCKVHVSVLLYYQAMSKNNKLREKLDAVIVEYIKAFEKKHECDFEFAIFDDLTDMLCFGDNYFSFSDVAYDIDNNVEKGLIFKWQNEETKFDAHGNEYSVNFRSYVMGFRSSDI